jgi:hypothetical protein
MGVNGLAEWVALGRFVMVVASFPGLPVAAA